MPPCRLCGNVGKLVKAHIIPAAFFRSLREEDAVPLLVTPNRFPKRSPIGVYDETILCDACEPKFDRFDSYGVRTLLHRLDDLFHPITHHDEIVAYEAKGIDRKLLLQFLLATLWRASVSTQPYYKRVNLGPYEEIAKHSILKPEAAIPLAFDAVLSRWTLEESHQPLARGIMDPFRERWDNVNAYRFYFGHVVAYIKVDRQPFLEPLQELSLLNRPVVTMVPRSFIQSSDFAAMVHTAKQSDINMKRAKASRAKKSGGR